MGSFVGASQPLKSFGSDVKAIKRFSQVTELPRFGSRLLNASSLVLSEIPLDAIAHDISEQVQWVRRRCRFTELKSLFGVREVRELVIFYS